jgi:hypothetical protein
MPLPTHHLFCYTRSQQILVTAPINIHEAKAGKLLWRYDKELSRGLGSNTNTIINAIMRKASKEFPYENINKIYVRPGFAIIIYFLSQ